MCKFLTPGAQEQPNSVNLQVCDLKHVIFLLSSGALLKGLIWQLYNSPQNLLISSATLQPGFKEKVRFLPVKGVAHLNGDQHRQGHGHRRSSLKHLTFNSSKVLVFIMALHKVGLDNKGKRLNTGRTLLWWVFQSKLEKSSRHNTIVMIKTHQLIVGHLWTLVIVQEPVGSSTNSGSTNVSYK